MTVRRIYKTVTATTTTAAGDIGTIRGKILMIQVKNSAASCDWHIFSDASDNTAGDGEINDQDILGTSGGKISTAAATYYPVVAQVVGSTAATTDPDQYHLPIVDGKLEYSVANCANTEVLSIIVWYEPL